MPSYLNISIAPVTLEIGPGESAEVAVTVQNTSNVVDVFALEVVGLEPSWCQFSTIQLSLFPNDQESTALIISPPKESLSLAQSYDFQVRVVSQKDSTQSSEVACNLHVLPFHDYSVVVRPNKATGAKGFYAFSVVNSGNADLNVEFAGQDPEDLCRFLFDPQRPMVAPGETAVVSLLVEPSKRPLKGRPRPYRFSVTATPDPGTGEPTTLYAELDATARVPDFLSNLVAVVLRRRRNPDALPRVASGSRGLGEADGGSAQKATRLPNRMYGAAVAAVAVIVIIAVAAFILTRGPGVDFQGGFSLDPGEDVTFGFALPDGNPVRVRTTGKWSGAAQTLEVTFRRPDGSESTPVNISPAVSTVNFRLDQAALALGSAGWAVNIKNNNADGRAEGKLSITFTKTR